mmetsp:Transcript_21726/g.49432  ORF Transcript_21726/g.49432 Transcript_21726/m.49432 type:complete len:396 (-) Transcript_21726:59-1246(-)
MPSTAAERSAKHRRQAERCELRECMERVVKTRRQESNWSACPALEKQFIREGRMKGELMDVPATLAGALLAITAPELGGEEAGTLHGKASSMAAMPKSVSALTSSPWQKNNTALNTAPVWAMKLALGQISPAICSPANFRSLGRGFFRDLTLEVVEFYCQVSADFNLGKGLRNDKDFVAWLIERGQCCGGSERTLVLKNPMAWETQGVYAIEVVGNTLLATHRFSKVQASIPWVVAENGPFPSEVAINYSDARACVISDDGKTTRTLAQFVQAGSEYQTPPPKRCRLSPKQMLSLENGQVALRDGCSLGLMGSLSAGSGSTRTPASEALEQGTGDEEVPLPGAALAERVDNTETPAAEVNAESVEPDADRQAELLAEAMKRADEVDEDGFAPIAP